MEKYSQVLSSIGLFRQIDPQELMQLLKCLEAKVVAVNKDEFIILEEDDVDYIGIVLTGQVHIIKEDVEGVKKIIAVLEAGDNFGEAICCAGIRKSPISARAVCSGAVMKIKLSKIMNLCTTTCSFHLRLIENLLYIIAQKNVHLQNRFDVISQKSIRQKVLSYLRRQETLAGEEINISLNREEMADFLCVDRSALSHELSRMKAERIIQYHKNRFQIL